MKLSALHSYDRVYQRLAEQDEQQRIARGRPFGVSTCEPEPARDKHDQTGYGERITHSRTASHRKEAASNA